MVAEQLSAGRLRLGGILSVLALSASAGSCFAQSVAAAGSGALQEIVVTATRRAEPQMKVPISLSVVTKSQIDRQGFSSLNGIARVTPGVQFDPSTGNVVIRGIDGTSIGAGTVGIYIDDTPIQIRTFGTNATNAIPRLFDVDRVEILRGPQGTLFGAGSEGGTVRYILTQPSLERFNVYAKGEVSETEDGGIGGYAGVGVGGPLIPGVLGFRVSAYHQHTAGYVDRVHDYAPYSLIDPNSNWADTNIFRAALTIQPETNLTITPSLLYQSVYTDSSSAFVVALSDPANGIFHNNSPTSEYKWNQWFLPSLHLEYQAGFANLIYDGSYFDRGQYGNNDYDNFFADLFGLSTATGPDFGSLPNYDAHTDAINTQRNLTQEVRLQSSNPTARVSWVAGLFYSRLNQNNRELTHDPQYYQFFSDVLGYPNFGPLVPPDFSYMGWDTGRDVQEAVYTQLDFHLTEKLTLTLGERYSRFQLSGNVTQNGPYAGGLVVNTQHADQSASTPKIGVSYQANDRNLFYATVSKGFRPGGIADPYPATSCAPDLQALGITGTPPVAFNPDSLWSYEVGAKNVLAGGHVRLATSLYRIEWKNIQTAIGLPSCGYALDTNLGTARSDGFDFQADVDVAPGLTVGLTLGRTDPRYTQTIYGGVEADGSRAVIADAGNTLGAPPWTATGTFDWTFGLLGHSGYLRGDYSYVERNRDLLPSQDPLTTSYDPATYPVPTSRYVTLRAGIELDQLDASLFVDNLTNESTFLSYGHAQVGSPLFTATVDPPRTFGLTLVYRY